MVETDCANVKQTIISPHFPSSEISQNQVSYSSGLSPGLRYGLCTSPYSFGSGRNSSSFICTSSTTAVVVKKTETCDGKLVCSSSDIQPKWTAAASPPNLTLPRAAPKFVGEAAVKVSSGSGDLPEAQLQYLAHPGGHLLSGVPLLANAFNFKPNQVFVSSE